MGKGDFELILVGSPDLDNIANTEQRTFLSIMLERITILRQENTNN